jgi:transcriptional regulator with XRE-family HTH domain
MTRQYVQQLTKEEMQEYGEFFKQMRKSIKYSLQKMSDELGIALSTLHRWEQGKIVPREDMYFLEQKFRDVVKAARNVS